MLTGMKGLKPKASANRARPKPGLQAATQAHEDFVRELIRNGDTKPEKKKATDLPKSTTKHKSVKAKLNARTELTGSTARNNKKVVKTSSPVKIELGSEDTWRDNVYRTLRPAIEEGRDIDFKWLEALAVKEGWSVRSSEVELKDKLGEGSCGTVYTAKWRHLPVVAKKFLEKGASRDDKMSRQRQVDLGSEISILSTLKHPNIVSFFGASFEGNYADTPIYLMEMCPKGDLEQVVQGARKNNSFLKEHEMAKYIYQIGLGIEYLHSSSQPIVHRDLKPQNILISAHGVAKLTDFGLATIIPKKTHSYRMTGHTGSLRYMAPEVFLGKSYSEKVDIYSYAMIIYYIAACYRPYGNVKVTKELAGEISQEDKRPDLFKIKYKSMRLKLAPLLRRAWSPAPSSRPHCHAILTEFEELPQFKKLANKGGCSIC